MSKTGIDILTKFRHLISMPFIYGMIFPSIIFHLCLETYHQVCFRLYRIPLVDGREYFIYDRHLLDTLNFAEKFNCIYCSYVNNLFRYSIEVGGRTERYWCPLKYKSGTESIHSQYEKFLAEGTCQEMKERRVELRDFSDLE